MTASASERYLIAKKRYADKHGSVTEHNNKLRVELMQYAMRKSLR